MGMLMVMFLHWSLSLLFFSGWEWPKTELDLGNSLERMIVTVEMLRVKAIMIIMGLCLVMGLVKPSSH